MSRKQAVVMPAGAPRRYAGLNFLAVGRPTSISAAVEKGCRGALRGIGNAGRAARGALSGSGGSLRCAPNGPIGAEPWIDLRIAIKLRRGCIIGIRATGDPGHAWPGFLKTAPGLAKLLPIGKT